MVLKPCALQNCFLIRRHLPDGHSQSETHSDLLPEYLVIRMVGAIMIIMIMILLWLIDMIMRTTMSINTGILIKLRTLLRKAIPSLKLIHNWSCFVLKYCISVFPSHICLSVINCELQLKHCLVYMVNVSVSRHGQHYCWKYQYIDCPVIFQSKAYLIFVTGTTGGACVKKNCPV